MSRAYGAVSSRGSRNMPTIPSGDEDDDFSPHLGFQSTFLADVLEEDDAPSSAAASAAAVSSSSARRGGSRGHALMEGFGDEDSLLIDDNKTFRSDDGGDSLFESTKRRWLYVQVCILSLVIVSIMVATTTDMGKSAMQRITLFSEVDNNGVTKAATTTTSTSKFGTTTTAGAPSTSPATEASSATSSSANMDSETDLTTTFIDNKTPTMFPTDVAPTRFPTLSEVAEEESETTATSGTIAFTINRDGYGILPYFSETPSEFLKYKFLEGYTGVVEPNADMYPYVFDEEEASAKGDETYYYTYTICKDDDETREGCDTEHFYSEPLNKACTPLEDTYTVVVSQYETATQAKTGATGQGSLMCVYVRREMRALTSSDLTKTMDAMWKMWELEEDEGQALYGEDFRNFAYLLEYHYFNAAWQDADHIHEGNGFLTQHIKMDGIFETSMQAVDNSISLPYWDFTIENATGLSVWESPVFTPDTFGTLALPSDHDKGWVYELDTVEDGGIQDGRWVNFRADKNEKYPELLSAYGYMRAPWNMNPANIISRYTSIDKNLPTCQNHYELLSYTLLSDFMKQVPYDAHASTHGVLGGVYGCDAFDPLLEAGYINDEEGKLNLCKNWIFYLKEFYRDNVITPNSNCTSVDANGGYSTAYDDQKCGFTCVPEMLNILILQLERSVLNSDYDCVPTVDEMPAEGWVAWRTFICEGDGYKVFGGDHLESASPADPSFWPIHPTLERLLQARLMSGGFPSMEWPTDPVNDYVCNKATCFDTFYATTDDTRAGFGSWDNCCYGHFIDDQILDAPNGDRFTAVGPTNREVMEWTDPTSETYGMPYIYDNFAWDHCVDQGYDFDELLLGFYVGNATIANSTEVVLTDDLNEKGWRKSRV